MRFYPPFHAKKKENDVPKEMDEGLTLRETLLFYFDLCADTISTGRVVG
jgi:hypothetical protein